MDRSLQNGRDPLADSLLHRGDRRQPRLQTEVSVCTESFPCSPSFYYDRVEGMLAQPGERRIAVIRSCDNKYLKINKGYGESRNPLILLVGATGFEPVTSTV